MMKILIAFFFTILSLSINSQSVVIDGKSYRPIIGWNIYDGAGFKTNLNIPKVIPTTGRDSGAIRYNIADSSIYVWTGWQWRQMAGSGGGGAVSSVFTRTGAVTALEADYNAFYPLLSGTYNNPSWLNQLAWSKITGTPTTLSGYGITDGGTVLNNVGTGFDLAQQGTDNVKRLALGFGLLGDSTSTVVTIRADSSKLVTVYANDTAKANIRAEMSFEGITYGTVVQRLAIDTSTLAEGHSFYQTDQRRGKYEFSSEMGWRFIGAPEMYVVNDQFAFEAGAVGSQHTASVSGTGAVARFFPFAQLKYDSLFNRGNGVWELATGTTSTGFAMMFTNSANFGVLRNSRFYTEARIWIDTLSNSTESYLLRVGIKARGDLPNASNAAYFVYSDTTFSSAGTWATVTTTSGGLTSMKNTGIVPTANTWVRLGIEWYSDVPTATYRAKFYINDVLVGTHENIAGVGDNITTTVEGGSHVTSSSLRKLAGATNRQIFFDYYNAINQNKQ